MPELLAALCSLMLATGAVASPPSLASRACATVLQGAAGSQGTKQEAPAAQSTQTPLQMAQALLAQVDELAHADRPTTTAARRKELLETADKLCDAADVAAKGDESAREAFTVRWLLAKRAFDLAAWRCSVDLNTDILSYEVSHFPAGSADILSAKRCLAESLSNFQRTKPWTQRDYKPALGLFKEVADAWDDTLKAALATPGNGPLPELFTAADARRELGVTYYEFGARSEARVELGRAHTLLCTYIDRLEDPSILRLVCADDQDVLLNSKEFEALCEATATILAEHFKDRQDLIFDLRADLAKTLSSRGQTRRAAEVARGILADAEQVAQAKPEVMIHLLHTAGQIFISAGMLNEAEAVLRRGVALGRKSGVPSTNWDSQTVYATLATALVGLGRYQEAIATLEAGDLDPWVLLVQRAKARGAAGYPDQALADLEEALRSVDSADGETDIRSAYRAGNNKWEVLSEIALIHAAAGRTSRALAIFEDLLDSAKLRPRLDTDLEIANDLQLMGWTHYCAGDVRGAHQLFRQALDDWLTRVDPDELFTQYFRSNLGSCAFFLGQYAEAEQLERDARDALLRCERTDYPWFLPLTESLAESLTARGRLPEAQKLAEEGLERAKAAQSLDPWDISNAHAILGAIALGKGDSATAVELLRDGLAGMRKSRWAALNRETITLYRAKLISALAALSDPSALPSELRKVALDSKERLEPLSVLSARERGDVVANMTQQAEQAAAICRTRPDAMDSRVLFEWLANLRAAGGPVEFVVLRGASPEIAKLRTEWIRTRQRVAAMSLAPERSPSGATTSLFEQAVTERDAAERKLLEKLPPGSRFAWLEANDLAVRLDAQDALGVSIHRIRALPPEQKEERFLAFTLDGKAHLRMIDLGPTMAIESKIQAWRQAASGQRGKAVPSSEPDVRALGSALREAVLDKLLEGAKEKRIFLCLDDALHTVPWDALPAVSVDKSGASADAFVGDKYHIAELSSFRDLLEATHRPQRQPALLAFGSIDYSAPGAAAKDAPLADRPMRGSAETFTHFDPLLFSTQEVDGIASTFEESQKRKSQVLKGDKATKEALFRLAKDATCLHISTHGYFASEGTGTAGDPAQGTLLSEVTGFAPLSLCGLALAGANKDVGAREEVVGIATAEELAGLDLSACQLAVLSGCETNLGVRRAGQDLASLKSALHAAGARNVIASLWGVPDEQTSQLMRRFYEYLWKENLPPDEALWKAKCSLRKLPLQAWAGWVFSGVPESK